MEDSRQSQFDPDLHRAHNVLVALERFADEVRRRAAVNDVLQVVKSTSRTFKGGYVKQAPEYFTEKYLIEPVLEELALEPWPRPVDLMKDERNRPDYRLDGVGDDCLAIGESKALNEERRHQKATEDMEEYLSDRTFLKTLRGREVRYSVGVATDGLAWTLLARDVDRGVQAEIGTEYIDESVATALQKANSTVDPEQDWMPDARGEVAESLVTTFSRENILEVVAKELAHE